MTLKVYHKFLSGKADGGDSTEVKPSDWNDAHELVTDGSGGTVVGRDTSGPGALQELPLAYDLTGAVGRWVANVVGSLRLPRGTTAQRPAGSTSGEMRWNTELSVPEMYDGAAWQIMAIGTQSVQTGMIMGWYSSTLPPGGWLFLNGQTVGDASSGAAQASAIYQALFAHLWSLPILLAVSGGRGADAASDWTAHKTIPLLDERGLVTAGPEAAAGNLPAGADVPGKIVGAVTQTAPYDVTVSTGFSNQPATYGISGGGPGLGDHNHQVRVFGNTSSFSVVQKTIIRNSIIKV